jgi:PAS domain S-box-containing protein
VADGESNIKADRSKNTKTLIQSIDNLRPFIDQTVDAIIVLKELDVIYANRSVEKLFGYTQAEMMSKPSLDFLSEAAKGKVIERYNRRMAGEDLPPFFETEVVCKDGTIKPVEVSSCVIEYEGKITFIVVVRDISDRKAVEEALKESEARYKALYENMMDAMVVSIDGKCVWANPAFADLIGYSLEETLGKTIEDLVHPDELLGVYDRKKRRLNGDEVSPFYETVLVRKDGSLINMEALIKPVKFDGQEALQVNIRDVTERKRAEKALIQSEEKYRLLFENAEESIFLVSEDGIFRMMNKKAAKYLGGKAEDFVGKNMTDLFPPSIARRQMKSIRKVLKSNRSAVIQSRTIVNQVERTFRTSIIPLADRYEGKGTAQLIAHDVTDLLQRQLQDEVRLELNELLRDTRNIDRCLELGCQAIFKAELFKRAVFTLHNKERQITHMGYVGIDKELAEKARNAPPPSEELARKMMRAEFKIGKSYFIPAEAGFRFKSTPRFISQSSRCLNLAQAWKSGDELFVPVFKNRKEIAGWLSVDTPFSKLRPNTETIQFLEQVVEKVYFKIRDLINIERIKAESTALKEKNIALKEVLSHIEEEKMALRREVAGQIERAILPAIDKAMHKKKDSKNTYIEMARKHLLNLASFSSGSNHIYSKLSRRESEICQLIKAGHTNKEMAEVLAISISTIQKHRESIRRKFGLKNKSMNLAVFLQKLDYL